MYCYILLYYLCIVIYCYIIYVLLYIVIYKWYDTDYEICNIVYIVYTHIYM